MERQFAAGTSTPYQPRSADIAPTWSGNPGGALASPAAKGENAPVEPGSSAPAPTPGLGATRPKGSDHPLGKVELWTPILLSGWAILVAF